MEFRTKREAEEAARRYDELATNREAWHAQCLVKGKVALAEVQAMRAKAHRAEAARIRALLPGLEE